MPANDIGHTGVRPLRIAALQPSISIVLKDLHCLDLVVACTRYCIDAVPELADLPVQVIHDSWSAKTGEILASQPNLVLASVPYRMDALAAILKAGVAVLTLAPHTLADIYADIALLGGIVHRADRAADIIASMQSELAAIEQRVSASSGDTPLVYCEEWGKPLIHSQAWVDELVAVAGGRGFGKPGITTDEASIRNADPDVLLFAWCGAGERVPLEKLVAQRGWADLRAVKERRVYCIRDEWLNTPAPSLVYGARAIAVALHPALFVDVQVPRRLSSA